MSFARRPALGESGLHYLCPLERERNYVANGIGSEAEHDQSIDAQGDSCASRQTVLHGGQQSSRLWNVFFAGSRLTLDARLQFDRIRQFVVAVAEFDAVDVQLEAFGDSGLSLAAHASQRGL